MDTAKVHFRFDTPIRAAGAFITRAKEILNFERKLSRRTKIILAIALFAMWLTTPNSVEMFVVSAKCINYGLGLLIHGLMLYRKEKPYMGIPLNLGRPVTTALGAILVISGIVMRGSPNCTPPHGAYARRHDLAFCPIRKESICRSPVGVSVIR